MKYPKQADLKRQKVELEVASGWEGVGRMQSDY